MLEDALLLIRPTTQPLLLVHYLQIVTEGCSPTRTSYDAKTSAQCTTSAKGSSNGRTSAKYGANFSQYCDRNLGHATHFGLLSAVTSAPVILGVTVLIPGVLAGAAFRLCRNIKRHVSQGTYHSGLWVFISLGIHDALYCPSGDTSRTSISRNLASSPLIWRHSVFPPSVFYDLCLRKRTVNPVVGEGWLPVSPHRQFSEPAQTDLRVISFFDTHSGICRVEIAYIIFPGSYIPKLDFGTSCLTSDRILSLAPDSYAHRSSQVTLWCSTRGLL